MNIITDEKKINELLARGVENIYPDRKFLAEALKSGRQLKLYLGIDPTGPALHIGHSTSLLKLRQFQELGHKVILLIGSFTAMIGDPTDKMATRKPLTREQVLANCKNYKAQAAKIVNFSGVNPVELKFNSDWLDKLTFKEIVEIAGNFTVQQMLERDMFEKRREEGKPIGLHEFLYPLMQGYDSVAMDVDGEVGGNDQTFNMLAGRDLLKAMKGKEKFVLTMRLLTDPTGKKMGKTEGNMVTLDATSDEMFGKIMSWPDEMIAAGFESCTLEPQEQIKKVEKELKRGTNPRDLKLKLADAIVKIYHGEKAALAAKAQFVRVFSAKEAPIEMPEYDLAGWTVEEALVKSKLAPSLTSARRVVAEGGVRINEAVVNNSKVKIKPGDIIKKGKRHFIKIK